MLPRGTRAILDWPVAFLFPCLTPEPLPPGTAGLAAVAGRARPRTTPGRNHLHARARRPVRRAAAAGDRSSGCPPTCAGDPTRDAVQLYRWVPIEPLRTLTPTVATATPADLPDPGHLRVPQLIENG